MSMQRRISKNQISAPSPLMSPMALQTHLAKRSTDSGIDVIPPAMAGGNRSSGGGGARGAHAVAGATTTTTTSQTTSTNKLSTRERLTLLRPGRPSPFAAPHLSSFSHGQRWASPVPPQGAACQSPPPLSPQPQLVEQHDHAYPIEQQQQTSMAPPPSATPFSAGRFDVSASVAGGPLDPRRSKQPEAPKTLSLRQYQSFVQACSAYRRQIHAMAAATDTFVRALEELSDCVPAANIQTNSLVWDLDFFIDSTQLLVNTHQIWASTIEKEIEEPLVSNIENVIMRVKARQAENKVKIQALIEKLHTEEDNSYKMKKKNRRDITSLQDSLNIRMRLAGEIKQLSIENETLYDTLAQQDVERVLQLVSKGVAAELETYEMVMEGLQKLGSTTRSKAVERYQHVVQLSGAGGATSASVSKPMMGNMAQRELTAPMAGTPVNACGGTHAPVIGSPPYESALNDKLDMDFLRQALKDL